MLDCEKLKKRWEKQNRLISKIIDMLKKGDADWVRIISSLPYTDEVENGRDLRGIPVDHQNLSSIDFNNINMRCASFVGSDLTDTKFIDTDLRDADFTNSILYNTDFQTADLRRAKLNDIKINEYTDWGITFQQLIEKRKYSQRKLLYLFEQKLVRYFGYKGKLHSETLAQSKNDYREVEALYRSLRIAYKSFDSGNSDYFFYREFHCALQEHPLYVKWLGMLWEKLSCAGSSPFRFFVVVCLVVLLCGLVYFLFPESIVRKNNENCIVPISNGWEALYFSVVTFTTLGYGDFHPNHDSLAGSIVQFLCCFEAMAGFISLTVWITLFLRFFQRE